MFWSAGLSLISDIPRKAHWPFKTHLFVNAGRMDRVDTGTFCAFTLWNDQADVALPG